MRKNNFRPNRLIVYFMILVVLIVICEHYWKKSYNVGTWKLWDPLSEQKMKLTVQFKGPEHYEAIRLVRPSGSPWPPESVFDLRDSKTGFYDMKIRPKVRSTVRPLSGAERYVEWLRNSTLQMQLKGSELRKIVYLDRLWGMHVGERNLFLYPLVINLPANIRAVKFGMEVDVEPINDPDLFVIKSPSKVCNPHRPKQYELIVIMKSCADCFWDRQNVRDEFANLSHWSDFRISVLFAVGLPSAHRFYNYLKSKSSIWEQIMHVFHRKIDPQTIRNFGLRKLFWESEKYDDLLIGSFLDTYYNLTLKQFLMFRWASTFCRNQTRLFMFMDHDQTLIPKNTIQFIRGISDSQAHTLIGGVPPEVTSPVRNPLIRNTKWATPYDIFPWPNYPPYPQGSIYLIGAQILEDIAVASLFIKSFPFEDVYLGIVAHKLNVDIVNLDGFWLNTSWRIDWSTAITVRSYHLRKLYNWKLGAFKSELSKQET